MDGYVLTSDFAFQSTLPAWGETDLIPRHAVVLAISIHSPRMGRDLARGGGQNDSHNFNPLSPHGERPEYGGTADAE